LVNGAVSTQPIRAATCTGCANQTHFQRELIALTL
jgi:hypothetical protein